MLGAALLSSPVTAFAAPLNSALAPKTSLVSKKFKAVYVSREKERVAVRECARTLCEQFQKAGDITLVPATIAENMQRLITYRVYTLEELRALSVLCRQKYLPFNDTGTYTDEQKKEIWRVFNFMILIGVDESDLQDIFPLASKSEKLGLLDAAFGGALHRAEKNGMEGGYAWTTDLKGGSYFEDPAYIDFLRLKDGDTYVDLMGGAGGEAIGIARKYPGVRAITVDLNSRNIAEAVRKAAEQNLENIRFVLGNAQASKGGTRLPDGSVRAITVTGFAFYKYPKDKLFDIFDEMFRIVAPDGRIFFDFIDSSRVPEAEMLAAFDAAARKHGVAVSRAKDLNTRKMQRYPFSWYGFTLGGTLPGNGMPVVPKVPVITDLVRSAEQDVLSDQTGRIGTYDGPLRFDLEQKMLIVGAASGEEKRLEVISRRQRYFLDLMVNFKDPGKLSPGHQEALVSILSLIEDLPPELYVFHEFAQDLFGCAFSTPNVIVLHEAIADYPVALFHEYCERLVHSGALRIEASGDSLTVLDVAGKTAVWIRLHSADALRQVDKAVHKPAFKQHYLLRALTREIFGDRDRELTEKIKDLREISLLSEQALAGDDQSIRNLGKIGYSRVKGDVITSIAVRVLERVLDHAPTDQVCLEALAEIKKCVIAKQCNAQSSTVSVLLNLLRKGAVDPRVSEEAVGILREIVVRNPSFATADCVNVLSEILKVKYRVPGICKDSALIIQTVAGKRPELLREATMQALLQFVFSSETRRVDTLKEVLIAIRMIGEKNPAFMASLWLEVRESAMIVLQSAVWPPAVNDEAIGIMRIMSEQAPSFIEQTDIETVEKLLKMDLFSPAGIRTASSFFRYASEYNPALITCMESALMNLMAERGTDSVAYMTINYINELVEESPMLIDQPMIVQLEKILGSTKYSEGIYLLCIDMLQKIAVRNPAMIDAVTFSAVEQALYEGTDWASVDEALAGLLGVIVRNCPHIETAVFLGQDRKKRTYRWFEEGLPFIWKYYHEYIDSPDPEMYLAGLQYLDSGELVKQIDSFRANAFSGPSVFIGRPFDQDMTDALRDRYNDLRTACPEDILYLVPLERWYALVAVQTGVQEKPPVYRDAAGTLGGLAPFDLPVGGTLRFMSNGTLMLELTGDALKKYMNGVKEKMRESRAFAGWYQLDKIMIPVGRIISETYTPEQLLLIRDAVDFFNAYGPFGSYTIQPIKIDRLVFGRLNVRGDALDISEIKLTGKPAMKFPGFPDLDEDVEGTEMVDNAV